MEVLTTPERRTKPAPMQSLVNPAWAAGLPTEDRGGWYAEVAVDGLTVQLSKLDGEAGWTMDAAFRDGSSMPLWMNGYGARYLLTKTLRGDLGEALDALAGRPAE